MPAQPDDACTAMPPAAVDPPNARDTPPAINAGRLKHLEMIQAVITRMAGNSFLIKGWSLTLLAALLTLALKEKLNSAFMAAVLVNLAFWWLDAYYLHQEKLYRWLWDVKRAEPQQEMPTDFDMNACVYVQVVGSRLAVAWSSTVRNFHGALLLMWVLLAVLAQAPLPWGAGSSTTAAAHSGAVSPVPVPPSASSIPIPLSATGGSQPPASRAP